MDWLNLTSVWANQVESLETVDDVKGSSGGDPNTGEANQPHISLGKRTEWLRAQHIILDNKVTGIDNQVIINIGDITDLQNDKYDKAGGEISGNTEWEDRIVEFKGVTAVLHSGAGSIMHTGAGSILHAGAGDIEHQGAGKIKHTGTGDIEQAGTGHIHQSGNGDIKSTGNGDIKKTGPNGSILAEAGASVSVIGGGVIRQWGYQKQNPYVYELRPEGGRLHWIDYDDSGELNVCEYNKRIGFNYFNAGTGVAGYEYNLIKLIGANSLSTLDTPAGDWDYTKHNVSTNDPYCWRVRVWGKVMWLAGTEYTYAEGILIIPATPGTYQGLRCSHITAATNNPPRYVAQESGASVVQADTFGGWFGIKTTTGWLIFKNNRATHSITGLRIAVELEIMDPGIT